MIRSFFYYIRKIRLLNSRGEKSQNKKRPRFRGRGIYETQLQSFSKTGRISSNFVVDSAETAMTVRARNSESTGE